MILYFADRTLTIIGSANTKNIESDRTTQNISSGRAAFTAVLHYDAADRDAFETMTMPGNYLLRKGRDDYEVYTIITADQCVMAQSVEIYAEDVGLDLINDVAPAYTASSAMGIADYITVFAAGSGFSVRLNEAATLTKMLEWDGDATVAERLASVAAAFEAELKYSFDIDGMSITGMHIDIFRRRGREDGGTLYVGKEIKEIRVRRSIEDLATALKVTGNNGLTLAGTVYDDGSDIYYDSNEDLLISRAAYAKWCRQWTSAFSPRNITRAYSVNTDSAAVLLAQSIRKLKGMEDMTIDRRADVNRLPDNLRAGDSVNIVHEASGLHLATRLQETRISETSGRIDAIFDDITEVTS